MRIKIYGSVIDIPALVGEPIYLEVPEGRVEREEDSVKPARVGVRAIFDMVRDKQVRRMVRDRMFGPRINYK